MKILDFKKATDLDKQNQTIKATLLCYFHEKNTDEQFFDMKGIQELFSDAGFGAINCSRIKKNLIEKKFMRTPKGMKTFLEFIPTAFQELENQYSDLWEDSETILSESELIDEKKFCGKLNYLN